MSGTSLDGLDIALCEVEIGAGLLENLVSQNVPYPQRLREELSEVVESGRVELSQLIALSAAWGAFTAESVERFLKDNEVAADSVDLIGLHGQTIAHLPALVEIAAGSYRGTLQIGEAEILAKRLGIVTVSDFRNGDIAVGGSGAPLAPIYHQQRFAAEGETRLVVNIGGIANVTLLEGLDKCVATDVGPGNCIGDYLMQQHLGQQFDVEGKVAAAGEVDRELAQKLASEKLFNRPLPGSLDRREVLLLADKYGLLDAADERTLAAWIATVTEFTATMIYDQTNRLSREQPDQVLVCGGGYHNQTLMNHLRNHFTNSIVSGTREFGSDPDFVEAECFAWLANLTIEGRAGNMPQVTGAERAVVLGKISSP